MIRSLRRRPAFTLLEVLLASLIAILLLSALYFAMDVTLRQTQASRDAVEMNALAQNTFSRIGLDLSAALGPLPPKSGGNSSSSAGSSSGSSSPPAATTPTAPAATAAPANSTGAAAKTPAASQPDPAAAVAAVTSAVVGSAGAATPQAADIGFQAGVVGSDKQLTIFASRLPGGLSDGKGMISEADPNVQVTSDLVRVTYWISQNGGLCRQMRPWVTADGVRNTTDPDLSNEAADLLIEEVTDATFEYFDGQSWSSAWDGSSPGPDTVTPIGPPRAVKVTLTFEIPSGRPGVAPTVQTISQVVPVRSAPGSYTPPMIAASTDPGTKTTDPSGSGSSAGGAGTTGGAAAGGKGASSGSKSGGSTPSSGGGSKSGDGSTPASTPSSGSGGSKSSGGGSTPASTPSSGSGGSKSSGSSTPSIMPSSGSSGAKSSGGAK